MKIDEIKLFTNRLDDLKDFYYRIMELPIIKSSNTAFTVEVGSSKLTFELNDTVINPYYHFAFNIVESKNKLALKWLESRNINLNRINDSDDYYSESWNSHAIYFYDPAGNIVELIARHNLEHPSDSDFTYEDMLNISEIGLPSEDVIELSEFLQFQYSEQIYISGNSMFTPIGDEEGLFILSSLDRDWLGSNKKVEMFPLEIVIDNGIDGTILIPGHPYTIITK